MGKEHQYSTSLLWTGNKGAGTTDYRAYDRDWVLTAAGKAEIAGSSDPSFRGSRDRYNPEELLVSSVSSCHMLWYLHLCAVNQVVVLDYSDNAVGCMVEDEDGGGRFKEVILYPVVTVAEAGMSERAMALHADANQKCFVANSCNFPIHHKPSVRVKD